MRITSNVKSHSLLGLDEIISSLESRANVSGAKKRISSLSVFKTQSEAEKGLSETEAMVTIFKNRPDLDIAPCEDPFPLLEKAKKGQALTGAELKTFSPILRNSEKLKRVFDSEEVTESHPLWCEIPEIHGLYGLIEESIDDDGAVRTDATPEIERLYVALNGLRKTIRDKAEKLLQDKGISPILQEDYVTLRENRFTLPVKAEHKSHIEGIIHDVSNTGQTFFIEPKALVDLNNRLKTVEVELNHEVLKLLADITAMIVEEGTQIDKIYEAITWLDVISAKASLAIDLDCEKPQFADKLNLQRAANPVMLLAGKGVVRNTIAMGDTARGLIISGPNTGGKTVALKTIGLLSLMAKMGLFITAEEGSGLPFYEEIFADIGDSQSISQDLSTFSAHLAAIKDIIENSSPKCLVLLDELMVSTDPKEGSALAVATLDYLVEKGATVVVTTHFGDLKILAQSNPSLRNMSMEFDANKAEPTYRIIDGAPGRSSAIAIAEKLGLDIKIISSAKACLEGGDSRIENMLSEINRQKTAIERERRESEQALKETLRIKKETEEIKIKLEESRRDVARETKRKLSADIAKAKEEISKLLENARSAKGNKKSLLETQTKISKISYGVKQSIAPDEKISISQLETGDRVYVTPLERYAILESLPSDGKLEVSMGSMRVTVGEKDIIGVERGRKRVPTRTYKAPARPAKRAEPTEEIDLRGMRVEEALENVEKSLDSLIASDARHIRIIHGIGTGALREAVREYLDTTPYKISFREGEQNEGGGGVTIITLEDS